MVVVLSQSAGLYSREDFGGCCEGGASQQRKMLAWVEACEHLALLLHPPPPQASSARARLAWLAPCNPRELRELVSTREQHAAEGAPKRAASKHSVQDRWPGASRRRRACAVGRAVRQVI